MEDFRIFIVGDTSSSLEPMSFRNVVQDAGAALESVLSDALLHRHPLARSLLDVFLDHLNRKAKLETLFGSVRHVVCYSLPIFLDMKSFA